MDEPFGIWVTEALIAVAKFGAAIGDALRSVSPNLSPREERGEVKSLALRDAISPAPR
jgi:hypothetical protein